MTENDPQEGPKIDPKATQNRHQNRYRFRCQNEEGPPGIGTQTLGRDPPPWEPLGQLSGGSLGGSPGRMSAGQEWPGTPCIRIEIHIDFDIDV